MNTAILISILGLTIIGLVTLVKYNIPWLIVVLLAVSLIAIFLIYILAHLSEHVKEKLKWIGLVLAICAIIPVLAVIACH